MITLDAADILLSTWAWWSGLSDGGPRPPGNEPVWRNARASYRKSKLRPSYDPDQMLVVDAAVATLKREQESHWLVLKAYYCEKKRRSERKLEAALRQFAAVY